MVNASLQSALNRSSGGSLAALLWEWAITFDSEVELIWSKSNRSWLKWMFLFARYFTIAVQFLSRALEAAISSHYILVDHDGLALRIWYSGQVMVAAFVVAVLEVVLMARVYALYNQERWIGITLLSFITAEALMAIIGLILTLPGDDFVPSMIITHLPASFAYFGICSVVAQCIVLILTARKYSQSSLKTVPLVRLMMRDGTLAFLMLTIFELVVVVYALCHISYAVTAYAWLLSAASCTTCRLIINMQAVSTNHESPNTSTTMIFTTIFTDQMAFEDIMSEDHRRSHFREIPTIDTSHRQATEFKQQDASIQTTLVRSTSLT